MGTRRTTSASAVVVAGRLARVVMATPLRTAANLARRGLMGVSRRPMQGANRPAAIRWMSQQASMDSHKFDPLDKRRRQLVYRSKQRGWLELDILMGDWSSAHLASMTDKHLDEFERILDLENPDLFKWLTAQKPVPEEHDCEVFQMLLSHVAKTMSTSNRATRTSEEWSTRQWWMEQISDEAKENTMKRE